MNIISKPSKENIKSYLPLGIVFISVSFLDVFVNAFFNYNSLVFFPSQISYFLPLLFGFIGLYLIRIEFSGIRFLDIVNKNINSNNFNAFLTLLTVFIIIKSIPPLLNWFVLDANFIGNSKDDCTGDGACWIFIKVWFNRFMYGLYPDAEQWRINTAFLILFTIVGFSFFVPAKFKKYFILFLIFNASFLRFSDSINVRAVVIALPSKVAARATGCPPGTTEAITLPMPVTPSIILLAVL
mgnify:CR=1 FL=1